jgi:hypothetical protein
MLTAATASTCVLRYLICLQIYNYDSLFDSKLTALPTPLSCVWPYLGQFWEKNQSQSVNSVLETAESRTHAYHSV